MPDQELSLNFSLNNDTLAGATWYDLRSQHALHMVCSRHWPCQVDDPMAEERNLQPTILEDHNDSYTLLYQQFDFETEWVALAKLGYGGVSISVASGNLKAAEAAMEELEATLPRQEITDEGRIPITFWAYTPNGPQAHTRDLDVPKWAEIREFYNPAEREEVDELVSSDFIPGKGGQLLLWRGVPGTGKTTALRAIGYEWREWAQLHVIADPERFFGDHADYMLQVMLGAGEKGSKPSRQGEKETPKWRILVLEDAGELLVKDSKQKVGQALSRFLNAVDGLIGQGLRFLVLVTTNEDDMGQLNEAVGRHGRAAFNTEFKELTRENSLDVYNLLRDSRGEEPVNEEDFAALTGAAGAMPLADIFALFNGAKREAPQTKVGFA